MKKPITLTDAELDYCNAEGINPTDFAKAKSERSKISQTKKCQKKNGSTAGMKPKLTEWMKSLTRSEQKRVAGILYEVSTAFLEK